MASQLKGPVPPKICYEILIKNETFRVPKTVQEVMKYNN